MAFKFPRPLALVDLETTGGCFSSDKIIEVALLLYTPASDKVEVFSTLVNPECPIPPRITQLTGISDEMVQKAPTFSEIADKIDRLTQGRVLAAHHAHFDYTFLKKQFKQLGIRFQRQTFCTLRFARRILPGLSGYGLDNLCHHFQIQIQERHRALGDVQATWELLQKLIELNPEELQKILQGDLEDHLLPPKIPRQVLESLPDEPGVAWLYDNHHKLLTTEGGKNLQKSLFQLLQRKDLPYRSQIESIQYELTGSELIAHLKQGKTKARKTPWKKSSPVFLVSSQKNGILSLQLVQRLKKRERPLLTFPSRPLARFFLLSFLKEFQLCAYYGGLVEHIPCCGKSFVTNCQGICQGSEDRRDYNRRCQKAISALASYLLVLLDEGRTGDEISFLLFQKEKLGYGYLPKGALVFSSPHLWLEHLKETFSEVPPSFSSLFHKWWKQRKYTAGLFYSLSVTSSLK